VTGSLRSADVAFFHPRPQGGAFQAKDLSGAVFAADLPVGLFKNLSYIAAFHLFQGMEMSTCETGSAREYPQPGTTSHLIGQIC